jgi:DNA-binding NarL/FixJ family response regulator
LHWDEDNHGCIQPLFSSANRTPAALRTIRPAPYHPDSGYGSRPSFCSTGTTRIKSLQGEDGVFDLPQLRAKRRKQEAARRLKKSNPGAKLMILTMHADLSLVSAAFEAGASGYVLKQSAATELVTALHDVNRGRPYISSLIQKRLGTVTPTFLRRPKKLSADLTSRQREVLQLLAEGRVRKEIAQLHGVSVKTVEFHKQKITEKLGIQTDAALTAYAIRHGIVSAE